MVCVAMWLLAGALHYSAWQAKREPDLALERVQAVKSPCVASLLLERFPANSYEQIDDDAIEEAHETCAARFAAEAQKQELLSATKRTES